MRATPRRQRRETVETIASVSFSRDGTRIVSAGYENTAKVWDARTGTPLLDLKGHTSPVFSVSLSPDATRIVYWLASALDLSAACKQSSLRSCPRSNAARVSIFVTLPVPRSGATGSPKPLAFAGNGS